MLRPDISIVVQQCFRCWPADAPPRADYDSLARQAAPDRTLDDGLNLRRTLAAMKRDSFPKLSQGFVYDCLRREVAQLDLPGHRQKARHKWRRREWVVRLVLLALDRWWRQAP